jgi:uncharacterized protein
MASVQNSYLRHNSKKKGVMAKFFNEEIAFVGREFECKRMRNLLKNNSSELLAIVGRRRVGKTFLVKKVYEKDLVFYLSGMQDVPRQMQLQNFVDARNDFFPDSKNFAAPKNWIQAFSQLKELLKKNTRKKRVLFFDELPWLASGSKEFLKVFDHFWNTWAVHQNMIVVICGSAASWMITNIINHKGGLHNRVTQRIHLKPFTLKETEEYFLQRSISMPRQSIIRLYMAMGGVPFYLREVSRGDTAEQAVNNAFFGRRAALYGEFDNLYKALFKNYEKHIEVVRALGSRWKGLTRQEIIDVTGMNTGGGLSTILEELESSDFIQSYTPYGKKERDKLYRLSDEYSLFYLHFIEANKGQSSYWLKKFSTPQARAWAGYAFESLCMKHIEGIKKELGISGIYTTEASFLKRKDRNQPGCQIDMLIDRADNAVNICEMKFYDGVYIMTEEDVKSLQQKRNVFRETTGTRKQLFITLITTQGLYDNEQAHIADNRLEMGALFLV